MKAQLFVLNGPDVGKSFELAHGHRAGRSPECEIVLRHASISRRHAHFEREGDEWHVVDDGSRNGVSVDRRRVDRAMLADGQEFQLGELELRFRILEAESAGAPPRSRAAEVRPAAAAPVAPRSDADTDADEDEIVLEGDEAEPATPPSPRVPRAAQSPRPGAFDSGFGAGPRAAGGAISRGPRGPGERVLQFHRIEAKPGLAHADLSQLSGPVKLVLALLAAVVLVAAASLAFFGTSWLKKGLGAASEPESVESEQ